MIKLTIVTPTYNRKEKLARNIKSVLAQTCHDIEHIIVDNVSLDGTEELVADYQKKADYPVVYIREKDTGVYIAMNKGVKRSRGTWVHILNSDDAYYSEKSVEYITDNKNDAFDVVCGQIIVDFAPEGGMSCWEPRFDEKLKFYNFPHPGTVIKNDFYKEHGYYDERFKIVSDSIFNIINYPKARYSLIDKTLVIMDGGGLSNRFSWRNSYEFLYHLFVYHKFPLAHKLMLTFMHFKRSNKKQNFSHFSAPEWWVVN